MRLRWIAGSVSKCPPDSLSAAWFLSTICDDERRSRCALSGTKTDLENRGTGVGVRSSEVSDQEGGIVVGELARSVLITLCFPCGEGGSVGLSSLFIAGRVAEEEGVAVPRCKVLGRLAGIGCERFPEAMMSRGVLLKGSTFTPVTIEKLNSMRTDKMI